MALTAALVHGFGPNYLSDIWNPFVPLLPFTLRVFLLYDAACGRKRALIEATGRGLVRHGVSTSRS